MTSDGSVPEELVTPASETEDELPVTHTIIHVAADAPLGLRAAEEVAPQVGVSAARLLDLAAAGYAPHWRVDGGQPLFKATEIKDWAKANLLKQHKGKSLPAVLTFVTTGNDIDDPMAIPRALRAIRDLRDITPTVRLSPGIYFVCDGDEVIYVGQSVNPGARLATHDKGFAEYECLRVFLLPWPRYDLNRLEGAIIRRLRPRLNGKYTTGTITAPGSSADDLAVLCKVGLADAIGPADG